MADVKDGGPATPLPWSVSDEYDHIVRGPNGLAIFACWFRGHRYAGAPSDAAANAQFIVRAVNSHHDMLAALTTTRELLARYCPNSPYCAEVGCATCRAADAAIAKAEGK